MSAPGSPADALEGRFDGSHLRIAVLCARYHGTITHALLERCVATLVAHGVADEAIEVVQVPGAWELPQAAARLARAAPYDAIVAIGCVIRGETPHFDYVAGEAARGLTDVSLAHDVPVVMGVLTTDTEAQALERADPDGQDKGREFALAALEMGLLFRDFT